MTEDARVCLDSSEQRSAAKLHHPGHPRLQQPFERGSTRED